MSEVRPQEYTLFCKRPSSEFSDFSIGRLALVLSSYCVDLSGFKRVSARYAAHPPRFAQQPPNDGSGQPRSFSD
jgi:hypothetical protein